MAKVQMGDTVSVVQSRGLAPVLGKVRAVHSDGSMNVRLGDGSEVTVNHISRSNGEVGWYYTNQAETIQNDPSNSRIINIGGQDTRITYDKAAGMLREMQSNLEVISRLAAGMRTNTNFHNSLDSQVQIIIEKAAEVNGMFNDLNRSFNELTVPASPAEVASPKPAAIPAARETSGPSTGLDAETQRILDQNKTR